MDSFVELVLDLLTEFVGGRGTPINNLNRFGGAIFLWGILIYISVKQQKKFPSVENKLLFHGFLIGFLSDLFKLILNFLELEGILSSLIIQMVFPPFDFLFSGVSKIFLGAAYLNLALKKISDTRKFLILGILTILLSYLVTFYWWGSLKFNNPSMVFKNSWFAWLYRIITS